MGGIRGGVEGFQTLVNYTYKPNIKKTKPNKHTYNQYNVGRLLNTQMQTVAKAAQP